ncbi:MAG: hypothetical protein LBT01_08320 [Spirochaetaceae bacterium]|jgi:hypothetical protein|nr:hypothetical protein [Spirochaetaceae bacterium]
MELETYLLRAGKETLVKYFALYEKNVSPTEIKNEMRKNENFSENTMKSKISYGRRIFKEHLEKKALEAIIKTDRLEKATLTKAAKLLEKLKTVKAKPKDKAELAKGKGKIKTAGTKPKAPKKAKA